MLAMARMDGERIRLVTGGGEEIWIEVRRRTERQIKVLIDAPRSVLIHREELLPESERYNNRGNNGQH